MNREVQTPNRIPSRASARAGAWDARRGSRHTTGTSWSGPRVVPPPQVFEPRGGVLPALMAKERRRQVGLEQVVVASTLREILDRRHDAARQAQRTRVGAAEARRHRRALRVRESSSAVRAQSAHAMVARGCHGHTLPPSSRQWCMHRSRRSTSCASCQRTGSTRALALSRLHVHQQQGSTAALGRRGAGS